MYDGQIGDVKIEILLSRQDGAKQDENIPELRRLLFRERYGGDKCRSFGEKAESAPLKNSGGNSRLTWRLRRYGPL